ncbi:MAG TPA: tetratricopeptide repeat protein [Actinomycetota bacterium]
MAGSYQSAGRTPEAIAIGEQVLAERDRILGPDQPDTLMTRNKLPTFRDSD